MLRHVCVLILALSSFAFLMSCGGGSSSSGGPGPTPTPAPSSITVTSVAPNTVQAGAVDTTIVVSGTNFVSASTVTFNGQQLATTYSSSTSLSAVVPASDLTAGNTATIGVSTPNTGASTTVLFQINNPAPVLTAITPNHIPLGSSGTFTLTGTGFVPTSTVQINGTNRTTTYVNATTLQINLSASDLAAAANDQITVVNGSPAGGTSHVTILAITQVIPVLSSVSPGYILSGTAATAVTLAGSNLSPTATVQANGSTLVITNQSSTSITATLPATLLANAGPVNFIVTNPGLNPESSTAVSLTVIGVPAIGSITPGAAPLGSSDLTITVFGSNYLPNSFVQWNGQALSTTYIASNQLTAIIPSADLETFVTGSITVSNPVAFPPNQPNLVSAAQNSARFWLS